MKVKEICDRGVSQGGRVLGIPAIKLALTKSSNNDMKMTFSTLLRVVASTGGAMM
jgi:hypothetical protein